ncbi:LysM peptidoglycan-binding domain-containing protein [Actinotalea sp. K2]|uniref:CIS tube protein n=1 Tax=Actinotalea sp. K2 TaxID=2939438 RepID=UPI002017CFDA|nr:LysM peptidoglycan-binding domain-containing protein [Actinotalea sp. K2]MCL3860418.1 LysM peptidoglycan-binding domain-containing protein [Actinotalea sp. K2]
MIRAGIVVSGRGAVSVGVTATRLDRATLSLKDSDEPPLHCQFNPTEYTISKSASWTRVPVRGAVSAAIPEFVGTNGATLGLDLFFDARASDTDGVDEPVNRLLSWTQPSRRSIDQNRPSPPVISFAWGGTAAFDAYLSSASARFVLFRRDGTPIRAHVALRLEEIPVILPGTNPTSGSDRVVRRRTVVAGDTLPVIAYQEYGRADAWRVIAEASGIDDPARVAPGTVLVVPEPPTGAGTGGRR